MKHYNIFKYKYINTFIVKNEITGLWDNGGAGGAGDDGVVPETHKHKPGNDWHGKRRLGKARQEFFSIL